MPKVKIKMIKTASGPKGTFTAPGEYEPDADIAEALVNCGSAKYVVEPEPEPEPEPVKPKAPVKKAPPAKKKAVAKKAPAKFKPGAKVKPTGDE